MNDSIKKIKSRSKNILRRYLVRDGIWTKKQITSTEGLWFDLDSDDWKKEIPNFELTQSKIINKDPILSIIIASYQNGKYIKEGLKTLVNSTIGIENIEILVVDDNSSDQTDDVVKEYLSEYSNIKYYKFEKNTGAAASPRNLGILESKGKYLFFLDADDWVDEKGLRNIVNYAEKTDDDFVGGSVMMVNNKETKSKYFWGRQPFESKSSENIKQKYFGGLAPSSKIIKRSIIVDNNLHFPNMKMSEDIKFFFDCIRFSRRISSVDILVTYMNRYSENFGLVSAYYQNGIGKEDTSLKVITWFDQIDQKIAKNFVERRLELTGYSLFANNGNRQNRKSKSVKLRYDVIRDILVNNPNLGEKFTNSDRQLVFGWFRNDDFNSMNNFFAQKK